MRAILVFAFLFSTGASAMELETTKVSLWTRGESIAGEEFIAMNESIVDYLGTLRRPTDPLKTIKYECGVKSRAIRPAVYGNSGSSAWEYVTVRAVYEIRDCKELR